MIKAKKSLGQHFLKNQDICQHIINLLDLEPQDKVLEIGPGPGALTKLLLAKPLQKLLLIEKDGHWAKEHQQYAEVIAGDALDFVWAALNGHWKLIGNLPYNVASPLLWNIMSQCTAWDQAVFMVQKEVAERICAMPNNRKYGALSVWIQCYAKVKMQFIVGPGNFVPPPKIDSAVVSFWPLQTRPQYPEILKELIHVCFQKRRKQLGNILSESAFAPLRAALPFFNIDSTARPENLSCQKFMELAAYWAENKI